MDKKALAWAKYWRNSLADASLGHGAFKDKDADKFQKVNIESFVHGAVESALVEQFFQGIDEETLTIPVVFRPYVFTYRMEHGAQKNDGLPSVITPLVCFANLSRSGKLYPSSPPVVPRDILEPLEINTYSIGTVDDLDAFLSKESFTELVCSEQQSSTDGGTTNTDHAEYWPGYKSHCNKLLEAVAGEWLNDLQDYIKADYGYILQDDSLKGAAQHVLKLYDNLKHTMPNVPVFDTYTRDTATALKQTLCNNSLVAERLAHASDKYGLAAAQRDALSHILSGAEGDILAINGPPGTGKTTLVLSLVATLWAKAAIAGDSAPVIIAASANNQATSNVIDAFGKDFSEGVGPLSGRWLPEVNSYGAYFPSQQEEKKSGDKYQTERFFQKIENKTYLESAEIYYKEKAQQFYDDQEELNISDIVDGLRQELISLSGQLSGVETYWNAYLAALAEHTKLLGNNAHERMMMLTQSIQATSETIGDLKKSQIAWSDYLANESIWLSLLAWLPPIRKKRERLARIFIRENINSLDSSSIDIDAIEDQFKMLIATEEKRQQQLQSTQKIYTAAINQLAHCGEAWLSCVKSFGLTHSETTTLQELDEFLDTTVRFKIFRLTVHYWEGRWLLEVRERLKEVENHKKNGLMVKQYRWQRRMMVTPCIVSTLYMLPTHMSGTKWEGDKNFSDEYNYNFIDLLIIDEGGLIPPELAGASLSLAKKAIVIGDTRQIEPIQSLSSHVDIGNLQHAGILPGNSSQVQYEHLRSMGKTVFGGSVMKAAQMLSPYHYDLDMERGMYLYEHRRCYNEIISYCNKLCYNNKLIAKRGLAPTNAPFPTIGHLHIDGLCQRASGGSRYNLLEAQTIAKWLADHRQQLETTYGKSLSEIVCVITPFGQQTQAISQACQNEGIKVGKGDGEMVVGTVHAVQGAERPVVICSSVYSKHADGKFIDQSNSMLNVAVSRAKDHFLVFGDMDVFTAHQGNTSPRGTLADYLFADPQNAINYPVLPRNDLSKTHPIKPLYDADEHDQFLVDAVRRALDEVHIVTPWIRKDFLENSIILRGMTEATARKVSVNVYTDFELNSETKIYEEKMAKRKELFSLIEWLKQYGIRLILVKRVHSKIVMIDSTVLCVGSFNWFSALRTGSYVRHETSLVYSSAQVKREIDVIKGSLKQRIITITNPTV